MMSQKLEEWNEEVQNWRGLSQAVFSECTKTCKSQEVTAVHILHCVSNDYIASCILAGPMFLQTSLGTINWGSGDSV